MNAPSTLDGVLFDLDGTVCLSGVPIGGIVEQLNRFLKVDGRFGVLVTNNSSKSRAAYESKLDEIGVDRRAISVLTPVVVGADYLLQHGLPRPYILGTRACHEEFAAMGVAHEDANPDSVVVAFDTETTYEKLDRCAEFMLKGLPVFQTNIDLFCPTSHGPAPDCGAIQALLTTTTGIRPKTHFGKPGKLMVNYLKRRFDLKDARFVMVGDRQSTDVLLGNRLGATSVWVRSGDPAIDRNARPDVIKDTMDEFLSDYS